MQSVPPRCAHGHRLDEASPSFCEADTNTLTLHTCSTDHKKEADTGDGWPEATQPTAPGPHSQAVLHGSVQPAAPHPAVPSPTFSSATPRIRQRAHVEWIRLPGRGGTAHSITHQAVHAASICGRWYPPHPSPLSLPKVEKNHRTVRKVTPGTQGSSEHLSWHRGQTLTAPISSAAIRSASAGQEWDFLSQFPQQPPGGCSTCPAETEWEKGPESSPCPTLLFPELERRPPGKPGCALRIWP